MNKDFSPIWRGWCAYLVVYIAPLKSIFMASKGMGLLLLVFALFGIWLFLLPGSLRTADVTGGPHQSEVVITDNLSENESPGWLAKWWKSWHVRNLLYLTPAQRDELHKLFHEKHTLPAPASAPVPTTWDVVEQAELYRQVAEADRIAAIARQRNLDIEVIKLILERGALPGEGTVHFTRRVAATLAAKRLGVPALDYRGALALVDGHNMIVRGHRFKQNHEVPVIVRLNMMMGHRFVMAPELALVSQEVGSPPRGYFLDYDFESACWRIVWTGKFKR